MKLLTTILNKVQNGNGGYRVDSTKAKYRELIERSEYYNLQATEMYKNGKFKMCTFYKNISNTYKKRAENILTREVL